MRLSIISTRCKRDPLLLSTGEPICTTIGELEQFDPLESGIDPLSIRLLEPLGYHAP